MGIAGSMAALLLLLLFLGLSLRVMMRGTDDVDCSCFGPLAPTKFGPGIVARNTALTALAALTLFWSGTGAASGALDAAPGAIVFSGLLVLATVTIYVIATSFWANRGIFRTLSE